MGIHGHIGVQSHPQVLVFIYLPKGCVLKGDLGLSKPYFVAFGPEDHHLGFLYINVHLVRPTPT